MTHTQHTLSSQVQSFASIVEQQQNEERKQIKLKRKLEKNEPTKLISSRPKDLPPAKMGKRIGNVGLAVAPAPVKQSKLKQMPETKMAPRLPNITTAKAQQQTTSSTTTEATATIRCRSTTK